MIIEQLQELGFTQYEALAYVALLKENPLNGYELAKRSGVPRPNIYAVLKKLEEHGAVLRMDTPEGARYTPLAPGDLISRLEHHYQGALDAAHSSLEEIAAPPSIEYTLNLRGYSSLLEHARRMIEAAQSQLLLLIWPEEALALAGTLQNARDRGLHIVTLCPNACARPCPNCQGDLFRIPITPADESHWLILIQDGVEMLAGEIIPQAETLAVRSRQKMLIKLAAGYIQTTTALARIINDLGGRFDRLVSPQARADLEILQDADHWFDGLRQRIQSTENTN